MIPEGAAPPTEAQQRAVLRAYKRGLMHNDFPICPMTAGAAAQTAMLASLERGGWITGKGRPVLTDRAKAWASVRIHNETQAKGGA